MSVISSFLLGIRFDLRYAGILTLFLLLTVSLPVLDPFRTKAGRRFFRIVTGIAAFLPVFFYTVDFAHYSYLTQRLSASDLNYLTNIGISARMVWQTYPVIRILILLIAGTWAIRRLLRWVYERIRRASGSLAAGPGSVTRRSSKWVRTGWFVIPLLLLAVAIFGRVG